MSKHVALLRGVNLGGRRIKMDELRAAFEAAGYQQVKTLLASGNVVFKSRKVEADAIEGMLKDAFSIDVPVILRSAEEIAALVAADPFAKLPQEKDTKTHISFLAAPTQPKSIQVPYASADGNLRILALTPGYLAAAVKLTATSGTLDLMDLLGKEFGDGVTTRTWNTVLKIHKALQGD